MSPRVLIIDDSLTVRMDLAEAFELAGFETIQSSTLGQAREVLGANTVDLLVLDVILPDGSGIDLLAEVRGSPNPTLPVILLSTEAEVRDRILGLKGGANEYVGKPYDRGQVISRARDLVRGRDGADAGIPTRPTILIIDDSATFRETLRQAIEREGFHAELAESGEEGLLAAANHRPSAMVVDGVLPGLDGSSVIRRIRLDAALRQTPCLLLTASDEAAAESLALDAGADAFCHKGQPIEVILAKLKAVLRAADDAQPQVGTESLLSPKRVLAVDDSPTYLHEISEALRGEGYDVVLARSAEEALEMLAVQTVDCILMDLMMPGMDGRQACGYIKSTSILRQIPLILLTALDDQQTMLDGLASGADDYINKSSNFEILRARVRAQIRRRQFEAENRLFRDRVGQMERHAAEAMAARALADAKATLVEELERKNHELEAFSYSVSHDLRAPLRTIDGFSQMVLEDCGELLGPTGIEHLGRVRAAAQRMSELIDDLLELSRLSRSNLQRASIDLTAVARAIATELASREQGQSVEVIIHDGLVAHADPGLIKVLLENLLGNAMKFSSKRAGAQVEVGTVALASEPTFFVRDNGAGFNMEYASKLFTPFQRLHTEAEFPGTGIGLATVYRIVDRHHGRVWAEGAPGQGARFSWTLPLPSKVS